MRLVFLLGCALALPALASPPLTAGKKATVTINGQTAGPTPFISNLDLTVTPPDALKSVSFMIEPKPSSVTRPLSATYSSAYLLSRGFLNPVTGHLTLPVFGLYANYDNPVLLTYDFRQGASAVDTTMIATAPWSDPTGGAYTNPTVVQPRTTSTSLSYDYVMLKGFAAPISPVIIDTDGEVRWVGTAGQASISAIFHDNGIYISSGSGITRQELDGASGLVANYAGLGVTSTGHHNYDPGKNGFLIEVNTTAGVESTVMEVTGDGTVLKTWKLADIVSAAMIAGGDNPSAFVRAPDDWFHNNACTYSPREDAIILSGREDFVIAIDYSTGNIKWILGDPSKAWYQYASLRKFALTLEGATLPPIGQHAVSITKDGDLLLFDDGRASLNQSPIGDDRTYSAPRKYHINARKMTATEVWNYQAAPSLYSAYCSSAYEDAKKNYLFDYTLTGDVIGLDANEATIFHYKYSTAYFCGLSWNAIPIHLEKVVFP